MTELDERRDAPPAPGDQAWSQVVRLAGGVATWLERASTAQVAVVCFVGAIALTGAGYLPSIDVALSIAQDPTASNLDLGRFGYFADSPIVFHLAHWLRLDGSRLHYALMCFAILAGTYAALVACTARVHGAAAAKLVAVCYFAGPLATVMLTWLGQPDPITFAAIGFVAVLRSRIGLAVAGLVLGMNHFEIGVFALVGLLLAALAEAPAPRRTRTVQLAYAAFALLAGRVVVHVVQTASDQAYADRLDYLLDTDLGRYPHALVANIPALVFSFFAAAWILVVWNLYGLARVDRRAARLHAASLLVGVAAIVVALDSTRVFALVTWGPLIVLVFAGLRRFGEAATMRAASWAVLLGVVAPRIIVWAGGVFAHGWYRPLESVFGLPVTPL